MADIKMTEKLFRDSEVMRSELSQLLANPTMQAALKIVAEKAKARHTPEPRMHAHLDTLTTQHYYRLLGVQKALDLLENLTEPNPLVTTEEQKKHPFDGDPYFDNLPQNVKDALIQRAQQQTSDL